jgi:hypothetical protein
MKKASTEKTESRSMRRAKLLRDGVSWRQACLRSGYSVSAANRGPKSYFENSPGVRRDFTRLAEEEPFSPDQTRKIAKNRLTKAVVEGKSSNVAREIELLGRFKEHDWWVKPSDLQLGIFAQLCDPETHQRIRAQAKAIDDYPDEDDAPADQPK